MKTEIAASADWMNTNSLQEAMKIAEIMANSAMVPASYKGKPNDCLMAMAWGAELGLPALQAIQNIAVINGRPSIWGDAALAVVMRHPDFEDISETTEGSGQSVKAVCTIQRKGRSPVTRSFSYIEAEKAGLTKKQGTWQTYPMRMLQMRARGFCMRDAFPDAMRGIVLAEEAQDTPVERDITPEPQQQPKQYPVEDFEKNFPAWEKKIKEGLNPERLITMIQSKGELSDEQKQQIRDIEVNTDDV